MTPSPWLAPSVSAHAAALGMVHAQRSTRPLFAIIVIITCPFMGVVITTLQRRRRQRAGSGWHRWHSVSRPSWDATWLPGPLLRCTTVSHANCVLSSSCQKTSPCHLHRGARGGCSHVGRQAGAGGVLRSVGDSWSLLESSLWRGCIITICFEGKGVTVSR